MARETRNISLHELIFVVGNIIVVWPLIVSYLSETGKKESGDCLVKWLVLQFLRRIIVSVQFLSNVWKKGIGGFFISINWVE